MYSFFILYLLSNILLYRVLHQLYNILVKRNIIIIVLRKNMEVKEYVKHVKVSLVNLAKLNRLSDLPNKYVSFCILNHLITFFIFAVRVDVHHNIILSSDRYFINKEQLRNSRA